MRLVSGGFELIPGLVTLFQEGAQPALFRTLERAGEGEPHA